MNNELNYTQEQVTKIIELIALSKDGYKKVLKNSFETLM